MKSLDPARFRHVSLSSPEYESEGIRHLTVFSNPLRRRGDVSFACPSEGLWHEDLPIVLLLHGVYGSHWSWFQQGGAHRVATAMYQAGASAPFVLACPSDGLFAEGSGYLPQHDGDFEAWILQIPELIRAAVPSCTEASPVFLCGLSMGGYGSLCLGTKYPERFAAISAHSPIIKVEEFRNFLAPDQAEEMFAQRARTWDILECVRDNRDRLPPLRFDCGIEDKLGPGNDEFHAALTGLGIAHTYERLPGADDWSFRAMRLEADLERHHAEDRIVHMMPGGPHLGFSTARHQRFEAMDQAGPKRIVVRQLGIIQGTIPCCDFGVVHGRGVLMRAHDKVIGKPLADFAR